MHSLTREELQSIPLFKSLSDREADCLTNRVYRSVHDKDQLLAMEQDWGDCIYLIMSGYAKVRSYSEQGDERVFCLLGAGDLFGEMSFLDGHARSADVVGLTEITLVKFPGQMLMNMINSNPELALEIARLEAGRLRDLNRRFSLRTEDALTRLLEAIAYIANKAGDQMEGECTSLPGIAQQEIGLLAGLSPETTSRVFKKLRERGVIGKHQGNISILNSGPLTKRGLLIRC